MSKLLRRPGNPIVVEFSLTKAILPPRADPNNYYVTLGLDPRLTWSADEIKAAFRERAKALHPDGSKPDPVAYDRLQVAYQVLSDPELRRKYDSLDSTQMWKDKDVVAAIIRKVAEARKRGGEIKELAPALKEALAQVPVAPPAPSFDGWAYYYYEGEAVPDEDTRNRWVEAVQLAAWSLDKRSEIRLGFTERDPHVVNRAWGQVLMASGDPSTEGAYVLVELLNDSYDFSPHGDETSGSVVSGHTSDRSRKMRPRV